ncbi:formate dehydrogenase subunit gamma [Rhodoferax ferrireducens]|uniref:formate dehydrogenase subunit gamma n=1 Tax=Rhodoferax ferrireducens TaxID=192843 RepID=UPI000E0D16BB|nr:formate dehydrogenase subunit gamma [Rhodoferax ferrireducens]
MLTETTRQTLQTLVAAKKQLPGALLPILHDIQEALGHVPAEAVSLIAQELNLSRAEVHGVVTFYHHFRSEPAGDTVVQICRAEACQSMGAERLWAHACSQLAVDAAHAAHGHTTADGMFTLEPVYCLGLCSSSPAMALNDKVHARVDVEKFDRLVAAARSAA